jgi:hypothetical protein
LEVFNLYRVEVILFQMDFFGLRGSRVMNVPILDHQVAIEPEAVTVLTRKSSQIVACFWRRQDAGPACRIVLQQLGRNASINPGKIDGIVGTSECGRRTFKSHVCEVVRLAPVLCAGRVHAECAMGNRF